MTKRLHMLLQTLATLGCLTLVLSMSTLFATSAYAATAKSVTAKGYQPPYAACQATGQSGWKTSTKGGYVGQTIYPYDPPCNGSYIYAHTPTKNTATWNGLRGDDECSCTAYLWAYFPTNRAGATKAIYTVSTSNGTFTFTANQQKAAGWYRLGKFTYVGYNIVVTVTAASGSQGDLLADAVSNQNIS